MKQEEIDLLSKQIVKLLKKQQKLLLKPPAKKWQKAVRRAFKMVSLSLTLKNLIVKRRTLLTTPTGIISMDHAKPGSDYSCGGVVSGIRRVNSFSIHSGETIEQAWVRYQRERQDHADKNTREGIL